MSKTQTGRKKSVLWGFIYVVSFIVVFAASALIKMTVDPMGGAFKAEWNDSVGTVHTDFDYGEGEANKFDLYVPAEKPMVWWYISMRAASPAAIRAVTPRC